MGLEVENILKEKGISYRLIALSQEAFTVDDVIAYADQSVDPEEICKTIIIAGKKSGKKIGIFLRGKDKLDFGVIKKVFGEEMGIATAREVRETSGVEPGAVCPFLLKVPLYLDENVSRMGRINSGSGHHLFGLEFNFNDLGKAVKYTVVRLTKSV
jgi:prolyl-tRNA editing enzyme YbaK/EbsC (Cys-tRNA(Pro) deacylase)